jgi:hypothetical protein
MVGGLKAISNTADWLVVRQARTTAKDLPGISEICHEINVINLRMEKECYKYCTL